MSPSPDRSRSLVLRAVIHDLATQDGPARPDSELRAAVVSELHRRGVADASEMELSFIVEAVQTSVRRASWKFLGQYLRHLVTAGRELRDLLHEISRYSLPGWLAYPSDVGAPPRGDTVQATVEVDLAAERLIEGRETIARVLADVADQSGEDDEEEVRPINCWLSLDGTQAVHVHVGARQVATLPMPEAARAIAAIRRWGGGGASLVADGDLYGSAVESAHLTVWFPAPADDA